MSKRISNREKYHFEDFTESAYRECLRIAKERYTFIDYHHIHEPGRTCLWRHDIDTSPQRALALARIEHEEGVTSTYFLLLHSDRYNCMDYQVRDILHELRDLGHHIGLHFDPVYYGGQIDDRAGMERCMIDEREILTHITGVPVTTFSFHNPSVNGLIEIGHEEMGGMANAISALIQQTFRYCSDSFCYWRFQRLMDVLLDDTAEKVHILTHPVSWTPETLSPYARFLRAAKGRADATIVRYHHNAKRHARKIIR